MRRYRHNRPSLLSGQHRNTTIRDEVEGNPTNIDQKYIWEHDVRQEMGLGESVKPRELDSSERKEMPTGVS